MKSYPFYQRSGLYGLCLSFLVLFSCQKEKKIETVVLEKVREVTALDDTIIWGKQLGDIEYFDNQIVISNNILGNVLIADTAYNFIRSFGNRGAGPGEFGDFCPDFIDKENGIFFLGNIRTIEKYSEDGKYLGSIPYPKDMVPSTTGKFFVHDGLIYFPCFNIPFVSFNQNGQIIRKFEKENTHGNDKKNRYTLIKVPDGIVMIGLFYPCMEKYSWDGVKTDEYQIDEIDEVKTCLSQNLPLPMLFKYAAYDNGVIYVALNYDNMILAFDVKKKIKLSAKYKTENTIYRVFGVYDKKIAIMNLMEATIDVFKIP